MPCWPEKPEMTLALGVDVSERRGLDLALLSPEKTLLGLWSRVRVEDLPAFLARWCPAAIGIDAPSQWRSGASCRAGERALFQRGIRLFFTPMADRAAHPFYRWMAVGMRVWQAVGQAGYRAYPGEGSVKGCALEVFPHATATLLAGRTVAKRERAEVLRAEGVPLPQPVHQDGVDATLAALTVWYALQGAHQALGDRQSGWIAIPRRP